MFKKTPTLIFFITLLLCPLILALLFSTGTRCASAENFHTIDYYYQNEILFSQNVVHGENLTLFPNENLIKDSAIEKGITLPGGNFIWKNSQGETIVLPTVITQNTTFYLSVSPIEEKVKYTIIYDYVNEENFSKYVLTVYKNAVPIFPEKLGDLAIVGYYTSPAFNEKVVLPTVADKDAFFYAKTDKQVTFCIDGKSYTTQYGYSINQLLDTETHKVSAIYVDESKTEKYPYVPYNNGTFYAEYVRTHYQLKINYDGVETILYVDVFNPTVTIETLSNYGSYFYENSITKKEISLPFTINSDVSIYSSDEKQPFLSFTEIIAIVVSIVVLAIITFAITVTSKKKQKARYALSESSADNTDENAESTLNNDHDVSSLDTRE